MEKIKVVWICHFSNKDIRDKLPLSKRSFANLIKRILGKQIQSTYVDFAPWITNQIVEFEKLKNVELHIVAPHIGLKNCTYEFEINQIYYHFFKPDLFFTFIKLFNRMFKPKKRKYWLNRHFVKRFISTIKPDIVNLIGAENPYYSITALDIRNIPVYVSLQTLQSVPLKDKYEYIVDAERIEIEKEILLKSKYFGTAARMYRDVVTNLNTNSIVLSYHFPRKKPPKIDTQSYEYDFVFFASTVSKIKGIEDAIDALKIVVKAVKKSKMNIIGSCNLNYKNFLVEKINVLGLSENISFSEYFPLHTDMFKQIMKSKIAVIPNKLDVISSTIVEAMYLGIPIVSYKTTGTPYLNREKETILLSEIGDIHDLASNMLKLLRSPTLSETLAKDAKYIAEKLFNNTEIANKLVYDYRAIVNHFNHKTPIPENLLFNLDEFPIY